MPKGCIGFLLLLTLLAIAGGATWWLLKHESGGTKKSLLEELRQLEERQNKRLDAWLKEMSEKIDNIDRACGNLSNRLDVIERKASEERQQAEEILRQHDERQKEKRDARSKEKGGKTERIGDRCGAPEGKCDEMPKGVKAQTGVGSVKARAGK